LVVEHIPLDQNISGRVVDFEDVIVVTVVQDIVAQGNPTDIPRAAAAVQVNDQGCGLRTCFLKRILAVLALFIWRETRNFCSIAWFFAPINQAIWL
jgi:hypothetical protein